MVETERLRLREWRDEDLEPFARMNADPRVMEFFPSLLTPEETAAGMERAREHWARHGFGWWAAELKETGEFIGFLGLAVPGFEAHFTPCVEIGWRLAAEQWGRGLATEGARASLRYGFEELGLKEIVSFTTVSNVRSRRVMEKIGMTRNPADDFEHPGIAEGNPLRRHVLYRIVTKQGATSS